jgi:oligoendopeptidase F
MTETLPPWRLDDLFQSPEDPLFHAALSEAKAKTASFVQAFSTQDFSTITPLQFYQAIQDYEALSELFGKLGTYTFLLFSENRNDTARAQVYQNTREALQTLESDLIFYTLGLCALDEDYVKTLYQTHEDIARYRPWLDQVRVFKPYTLEETSEKLMHDLHITSRDGWIRLFDQIIAGLRFSYRGEIMTETQVLHLMNTSSDPDVRKDAGLAFSAGLETQKETFALIINNLVKDKATEDRWRKFPSPSASRHLQNQVEGDVVETLVKAVRSSYPQLSHHYYQLKAGWMGQKTLNFWDRNAPLPQVSQPTYTWDQAKEIVLSAYEAFSPEMAAIGKRFFDQGWIHAAPQAGKDSGAYSHPCVPSVHPYILMNFKGSQRDVMTLAHELGHGIHQVLSADQGYLMSDTPLTIAETASVFGEMLTFQALLKDAENTEQRRALIASKAEDMLNTVVRQIAFHTFETKVHAARGEGELSAEDLAALWMHVQTESLGSAITLSDPYKIYWTYIQHFIHSPFYVYAYAFGDCLVNTLYATYQKQPEGFAEKYIAFLKKGGTQRYDTMLGAFGLNPKESTFWQQGLSVIEGLIAELS